MEMTPKHWLLALAAILGLVARVAFVQARTATQHKPDRRPPALPFSFPLIGHLPQFLWNPKRLMARASWVNSVSCTPGLTMLTEMLP